MGHFAVIGVINKLGNPIVISVNLKSGCLVNIRRYQLVDLHNSYSLVFLVNTSLENQFIQSNEVNKR